MYRWSIDQSTETHDERRAVVSYWQLKPSDIIRTQHRITSASTSTGSGFRHLALAEVVVRSEKTRWVERIELGRENRVRLEVNCTILSTDMCACSVRRAPGASLVTMSVCLSVCLRVCVCVCVWFATWSWTCTARIVLSAFRRYSSLLF